MTKKTLTLIMLGIAMMSQAMADEYICMPKNNTLESPACLGHECEMPNNTPKEFEMLCIKKTTMNKTEKKVQKTASTKENIKVATIW